MSTNNWTLKEKIGQLFIIAFGGEELTPELEKAIVDVNVGGVILFQRNLRDFDKVKQLIKDIQHTAVTNNRPPLWISIDQEGGGIAYLWDGMTISPGNMIIGATGKKEHAYQASFVMGKQLKKIGFNMNFAPDIDINNNPNNPVIGARSFGQDPDSVSELGRQSVKGYHDSGVLAVGKHFPGHGDTAFDSHLSLPKVEKSLEELEEFELIPFKETIADGMEAIMTAHILYPKLDPNYPATLSSFFLNDLLRKKYHFDGLIITDSMEMHAISKFYGRENGSVKALKAGADIILACGRDVASQEQMMEAVEKAVLEGEITEVVVEQALQRVLQHKEKWIDPNDIDSLGNVDSDYFQQEEFQHVMSEIARDGITLQTDREELLPLPKGGKIKVISQATYNDENYIGDRKSIVRAVFAEEQYDVMYLNEARPTSEDIVSLSSVITEGQYVVVLINERRELDSSWVELLQKITEKTKQIIVVSLWNPQIIGRIPETIGTYITTYSYTDHVIKELKQLLEGKYEFKGKSPVELVSQGSYVHE